MSMDWQTEPLTDTFGVEVAGVDLNAVATGVGFDTLRGLFEEHSALLFRGQDVSDDTHMALAKQFGEIEDRLADERKPGEAYEVPRVSNVRADGAVSEEMDLHTLILKANMLWHADSTFLPRPALTNILIGRVVTETGGATELASTRAGWAEMDPALKSQLENAALWHRYSHSRARISPELAELPMFNKMLRQVYLFVPIIILIAALFMGYSVIRAGTLATLAAAVVSWLTPHRMGVRSILKAFEVAGTMSIQIIAVCACAGIIVGVIQWPK